MNTTRPSTRGASAPDLAAITTNEAGVIDRWADDIGRAAMAAARRSGVAQDHPLAEDVAQNARIAVLKATRLGLGDDEHYVRRAIANSARSSVRRSRVAANEAPLESVDEVADVDPGVDPLDVQRVREWVAGQPHHLQRIYGLLYLEDLGQREAARRLGVSQPRVAQLHRDLLTRGRDEFCSRAA